MILDLFFTLLKGSPGKRMIMYPGTAQSAIKNKSQIIIFKPEGVAVY